MPREQLKNLVELERGVAHVDILGVLGNLHQEAWTNRELWEATLALFQSENLPYQIWEPGSGADDPVGEVPVARVGFVGSITDLRDSIPVGLSFPLKLVDGLQ